jgi:hypothetical protein
MTIRAARRLAALPLLLLIAACAPPAIAEAQFLVDVEDAYCEHLVACHVVGDAAACAERLSFFRQSSRGVAEGRVRYDGEAARECVEAVRGLACLNVEPIGYLEACRSVYQGLVPDGELCYAARDCTSLRCVAQAGCTDACCAGVCTAVLAEGAVCESSSQCEGDLLCMPPSLDGSASWVCRARRVEGEDCNEAIYCDVGLFCDQMAGPTDALLPGTCVRQAGRGEGCDAQNGAVSCLSLDDYCDAETSTCTARRGDGEPCELVLAPALLGGGNSCRFETYCDAAMVCRADAGEGGACPVGNECGYALSCPAGECRTQTPAPTCP